MPLPRDEDRLTHLRRLAGRMAPDPAPVARRVGGQLLLLALLVGALTLFGPLLNWEFPPVLRWLIPLAVLGGLTLLNSRRPPQGRRRPR